MKTKTDIWQKLAFASLAIDLIGCPALIFLNLAKDFNFMSLPFPLYWIEVLSYNIIVPIWYFITFCVWHWRVRYAGARSMAWMILFLATLWIPLVHISFPCAFLVALAYFLTHIVPDIRKRGAYANPPEIALAPPAPPLPRSWRHVQSACFVLGMVLIVLGVLSAIIVCIAHFVVWNIFADRIPEIVGETITRKISDAILLAVEISKVSVVTSLLASFETVIGAAFLYVSQRMRWRLLEEDEREKLRKAAASPSETPTAEASCSEQT